MTTWIEQNAAGHYVKLGQNHELWGKRTGDMTREELLVFIGFQGELAAQRQQHSQWSGLLGTASLVNTR